MVQCRFSNYCTGSYWKTSYGKNCPMEKVVVSEDECKCAGSQLGIQYKHQAAGPRNPAGCWFDESFIYFNYRIDPSLTSPTTSMGGVCTGDRSKSMVIIVSYFIL